MTVDDPLAVRCDISPAPDLPPGLPAANPESPCPTDPTRTSQPTRNPHLLLTPDHPVVSQLRDPKRYHILGEHGRGGLGRVSRAHDIELGRDVAIKELISRGHINELRFMREALITARLEHPGIVPVHEAGRWPDGTPFYAMKLVAGRPLRDLIAERPTLDERIGLLHHVIAVADALAYAHGRNIIHRDLKPSNVIVGDFGETVVIDWGLAKDLAAIDELLVGGVPFHPTPDDGLTSAGTILGTPAYMAPEQARGEPVDQRADVFAIGAMLWELCSLERLPPSFAGQRGRILRCSGIDQDLATIVEKALDPDPARRYPNAGALAADLKAFKAGARIAARRYSFFGLLMHWMRRHRAMASSVTAAALLSLSATVLYIRNVAMERNRADAALRLSEISKDALILEHAELLLRSDPTSALNAVLSYHGPDSLRVKQITAEAQARGVASSVVNAHSDTIYLLAGLPDGAIVSVGADRRILISKSAVTTSLANDVDLPIAVEYCDARHILAYSSTGMGSTLLDLNTRNPRRLSATHASTFAFSADCSRIAIVDQNSIVTAWDIKNEPKLLWKGRFPEVGPISFIDGEHIVVPTPTKLTSISLTHEADVVVSAGPTSIDTAFDYIAIGEASGVVTLYTSRDLRRIGSIAVCRERVEDVHVVSRKSVIVFACHDGTGGVADYSSVLSIRNRFATQGTASAISISEDGNLAVILSRSNVVYVHSIVDGLTHHYEGQVNLTFARAPTARYSEILTGDINGTVRSWPAPSAGAYIAMQGASGISRVALSSDGSLVAAGTSNGALYLARQHETPRSTSKGHSSYIEKLRFLSNGLLLSAGFDGRILLWNTETLSIVAHFDEHHGRIYGVELADRERQILSIGADGRLLSWSPESNETRELFATKLPLTMLEVLSTDSSAVICDAAGSMWHVLGSSRSIQLRKPDDDIVTLLRASNDGRFVVVGTARGRASVFDTTNWKVVLTLMMDAPLRRGAFAPDNGYLALATERHSVQLVSLRASNWERWQKTTFDMRDIVFSPDGQLLSIVGSNGAIWFYSFASNDWIFTRDHYAVTPTGRFSSNGRFFVAGDGDGVVVVRDVQALLTRMQ